MDKHIRRLVILSMASVIYIAFVSYMTFKVHSPLPFACVEELVTAIVFLAVFVLIAVIRAIFLRKKKKK